MSISSDRLSQFSDVGLLEYTALKAKVGSSRGLVQGQDQEILRPRPGLIHFDIELSMTEAHLGMFSMFGRTGALQKGGPAKAQFFLFFCNMVPSRKY